MRDREAEHVFRRPVPGQEDDLGRGAGLADLLSCLDPVRLRQGDAVLRCVRASAEGTHPFTQPRYGCGPLSHTFTRATIIP